MGGWKGFLGDVCVICLWPLALIAIAAVLACVVFTEAEYEEGVLSRGGRQMVRSRVFLGLGCAIYCLSLLPSLLSSSMFDFWGKHGRILLVLMMGANVSLFIAMVYGFQSRGSGLWIIRIAPAFMAIASTMITLLLISSIEFR
jgi:hypothetical protein